VTVLDARERAGGRVWTTRFELSKRAGRLVFAGEHTSAQWQGYMNGAAETGLRAARQLLEKPPQ
jgi:monoamine oxidase